MVGRALLARRAGDMTCHLQLPLRGAPCCRPADRLCAALHVWCHIKGVFVLLRVSLRTNDLFKREGTSDMAELFACGIL